jgi:hypothetical protein
MVTAIILVMATIVGLACFYAFMQPASENFLRYRARQPVRCPETGLLAEVQFDPIHAAFTGIVGPPELRIRDCSLWPHRRNCGQGCLDERA